MMIICHDSVVARRTRFSDNTNVIDHLKVISVSECSRNLVRIDDVKLLEQGTWPAE